MSNDTGLFPTNGHRIQGRSSESFLDAKEIILRLNLEGDEVFMDAGCGDGHTAIQAHNMLCKDALIYAVDNYGPSIEDMEKEIKENQINNIIPLQSDIAEHIPLKNNIVDVCLMINVFHGFTAKGNAEKAISELKRIIKPGGRIAVMDYKKIHAKHGPRLEVRRSPNELESLFIKQDLKMIQIDDNIGEDLDGGIKSHYLIVFQK
ncbi:class I SAM-dependent methyltransferase [Methanobacterium alcaliphilum]|uniref:class I SAM-dependent methyltransferase n=1 Tax=Methanobacterium alcaliphilum TaxID=392018 RepID=UPI00200B3555|nr:class I SAM-dependent methyltransferase [Methanobacterium alcaliphilum]MCK9151893.1 class I SAM-dependent methyltransferase [Methanobacterium alcaliphilum]